MKINIESKKKDQIFQYNTSFVILYLLKYAIFVSINLRNNGEFSKLTLLLLLSWCLKYNTETEGRF